MNDHLYHKPLAQHNIIEMIPGAEDQAILHNAIFSELITNGTASEHTIAALLRVVKTFRMKGCDAIALACTELPLVLNANNCEMPVLDTTAILAEAALQKASNMHTNTSAH